VSTVDTTTTTTRASTTTVPTTVAPTVRTVTTVVVAPLPPPAPAEPRLPVPADAPVEKPALPPPPATDPPVNRCAAALAAVAASGLGVPSGFGFYCPASGLDFDGTEHQGLTSFGPDCAQHVPLVGCYVDINLARIGASDRRLRHVVAHELCHAWDYVTSGVTSEGAAEACALAHGFPP